MKTLKKILLAAGVAFIGCFPVKKSFSQESNYIKFDFREDFGKEVINFDKNLSFSQMYVKGDIETRDVFTSFEAMLNEFFLDDYFKSAWGVKLIGDEKISLNPQIAVFLEAEKEKNARFNHFTHNYFFKEKMGAGQILNYDLKKLKGKIEIIFPFSDFKSAMVYTRHSLKTKFGEFEIFYKGKNIDNNYSGIKFTTNPFRENFSFFAEYSRNKSEIFMKNEFLNVGLTIRSGNENHYKLKSQNPPSF